MQVIERKDTLSLVSTYIDVFTALYVPEGNRLTAREKEYFIANIVLLHNGIDLQSQKASKLLAQRFGFINRAVSTYRAKLKKKGWIIQTSEGLEIPKAFNYKNINIPSELDFTVKIKLNKAEKVNNTNG